jgi:hypothetical protein
MVKPLFFISALAATLTLACARPSHAALFWLDDLGPLDSQLYVLGIASTGATYGIVDLWGTSPYTGALQPLNQPLQVLSFSNYVRGVNASGITAGEYYWSDVDTQKQWGYRLTPGSSYKMLKTPTGVAFNSVSSMKTSGINSGNRIAGRCVVNGVTRAFVNRIQLDFNLRKIETTTLLSTPVGYNSAALGIGEGNTIVGSLYLPGISGMATRWNPDGSWQVVAPSGSSGSWAACAAPNGRVAGVAFYSDGWHLFRTNSAGVPQDLGYDSQNPQVRGINSSGGVVGTANSLPLNYPLYISPGGTKYNLNSVYINAGLITQIENAYHIDESGNILATALSVWGERRVVRLTVINAE